MKQVIIYARWSSQEQSDGTTLERQIVNTTKLAVDRGFEISEIVTDEGISAYTADNIKTGNLAKLVKDFMRGKRDAASTILMVEELDRITRADASTAFAFINQVLSLGLTIMVANSGKTLDATILRDDIGALMSLVMENFNSNNESRKKAKRIASYWAISRAKGVVNPNLRHPSWLKVSGDDLVAKDGAEVIIGQMFEMALIGLGSTAIAKALNAAKIPTFQATKNKAEYWTPARVRRIIYNDAVIGYYTPYNRPRSGEVQRAGAKILRYPAMVSQDIFAKVAAAKTSQTGGRSNNVTNLIPRISRCFKCGAAMGARGTAVKGHYYLYCMNNKSGSGNCSHKRGWDYSAVEKPILDHLLNRAVSDDFFELKDDGSVMLLAKSLSDSNAKVHLKTDHLKTLLKRVTGEHDDIVMGVYDEVAAELTKAKAEAAEKKALLDQMQGKVSPEQHIERVRSIRDQLSDADPEKRNQARRIARDALAMLIDRVDFDDVSGKVAVRLVGNIGTMMMIDSNAVVVIHPNDDFSDHPKRDVIKRFLQDDRLASQHEWYRRALLS